MAEKQKTELNEDQIIAYLKDIVEKIKTEEDPVELNVYRRLFRKAVPFTLRSYFAAYLLKQMFSGKSTARNAAGSRNDRSARNGKKEKNERNENGRQLPEDSKRSKKQDGRRTEGRTPDIRSGEGRAAESRQMEARPAAEPRPVLADDVSTTLFISIGRNRRVYPRDLIGLIMQNVEIDRDHIGEIRVLDNYSFVQVITEDAEKIIENLNEFEYRGRKLAVSYSRKKDEPAPSDSGADIASDDLYDDDGETRDSSWISETDSSGTEDDTDEIR